MKYMIWNNKGGVGKTFITFILASEYAIAHPDEDIVVADLCPQANVSEMLLGGNGKGEINLQSCYDNQRTIDTFSSKIKESGIQPPKVHLFIQNKSRVLDSSATNAFNAHIEEIKGIAKTLKEQYPQHFTDNKNAVLNVKDGNTLAAILNHTGLPLSKVQPKTYSIYGRKTKANQSQIEPLLKDVTECLAAL